MYSQINGKLKCTLYKLQNIFRSVSSRLNYESCKINQVKIAVYFRAKHHYCILREPHKALLSKTRVNPTLLSVPVSIINL